MDKKDQIKRRLTLIRGTFNTIIEKSLETQFSIYESLNKLIKNIDTVDNDAMIEYLDMMSSSFMVNSQNYSEYCEMSNIEIEATSRYFEDDVKYMEKLKDLDYGSFDLRTEFNKLVEEISERIPLGEVNVSINDIKYSFDDYVTEMENFLGDYEYAVKHVSVDDKLKKEYEQQIESILYIAISLDRIIETNNRMKEEFKDGSPAKEISEDDFKKMMGE